MTEEAFAPWSQSDCAGICYKCPDLKSVVVVALRLVSVRWRMLTFYETSNTPS
jgi:hypothetical protein